MYPRPVITSVVVFACHLLLCGSTLRADTLLSNLIQPSVGFGVGVGTTNPPSSANIMPGQAFRTGSDPQGYRLNSVTLHMGGSMGRGLGDFVLELYDGIEFGMSSGPIGEFLVTSNPIAAGLHTFDFADPSLMLTPTTNYVIVASSPGSTGPTTSQYGWHRANFPDVTSGPGWLIGGLFSSSTGGATWAPVRSEPLQFALDATAVPEPTSLGLASWAALAFFSILVSPRRSRLTACRM